MTENLIKFPSQSEESFPSSREEAMARLEEVRTEYCDSIAEDAFDVVMQVLSSYNMYPKNNVDNIKDVVFLEEAIKATVYRYKNLQHSFHDIADTVIAITPEAQKEIEKNKQKVTVD